ncbi:acetyl-CoA carboxylase carboxyltransferase subunit beta [Lactiplantibacillus modestisalitolerans]|uniref:Acetyl-coenzyme A carboxylase carboxyl transferase subunit beta n=1 Tax=Lactiplantibacillus modestisalitolerans TaxID=1457219 RepID=A0ABV5WX88_9LACO|nr:acetyl-CoA carboxylase carboxyltransferase subunit beta [Lactiplantibacillus modestisalitolerans]
MPKQKFRQPTTAELHRRQADIPDAVLQQCSVCKTTCYQQELGPLRVCPHCGYGWRLPAWQRIKQLTDQFDELDRELTVPKRFDEPQYRQKIAQAQAASGLKESIVTGRAVLAGQAFGLGVMDAHFMMGSLGVTTGEKICRLFADSRRRRVPVVLVTASGGARMQEGTQALMQMAKVSVAVNKHRKAGLLYITILTDPTTGGVTASFAMQGDVILSEPRALIGFAGRRVIEQTIHETPPADFQRAETLLANGWLDQIVPRAELRPRLAQLLRIGGGHHG